VPKAPTPKRKPIGDKAVDKMKVRKHAKEQKRGQTDTPTPAEVGKAKNILKKVAKQKSKKSEKRRKYTRKLFGETVTETLDRRLKSREKGTGYRQKIKHGKGSTGKENRG